MSAAIPANPVTARVLEALPAAVDPLALSCNENPFPPLPAVRSALIRSIDAVNRYPEFLPEQLRSLVARHVGVRDEQVVLGAGATGVVMQILHALTRPGDRIVRSHPTFDGYPIVAQMANLKSVAIPLDRSGHHNLAVMAEAAAHARVVVLCRPHNPTGTLDSVADVERFLQRVPEGTVVLLDEAYIEFVAPQHRIDGPDLIRRFGNVIVLRTFSKAYGLAGLRIGYGFSSPELARALWTMQLPFGMGIGSAVAVAASYDAEDQLRQRVQCITAERAYLCRRLRAMGVYTTDTHANFIYLPPAWQSWRNVFGDAGVRARHYADGGVRITVGGRASTRAVLDAVGKSVIRRTGQVSGLVYPGATRSGLPVSPGQRSRCADQPRRPPDTADRRGHGLSIELRDVVREYRIGGQTVRALDEVSLRLAGGQFVSVVGPSGAGKSTLLHLLGALDSPDSGSITFDGDEIGRLDDERQSEFRHRRVGFVFQFFNLMPTLSAWENVAVPKLLDGVRVGQVKPDAVRLLDRVGLGNRTQHRPAELSGGQMQRIAVARALMMNPALILADEPTGNLDSTTGASILALLADVAHEGDRDRLVVMVTHNPDGASATDRVITLQDGRLGSDELSVAAR